MDLTKKQLKEIESLGYKLIKGSNPSEFEAGGQFSGGHWKVDLDYVLKSLEEAKLFNKMYIQQFGRKLYANID